MTEKHPDERATHTDKHTDADVETDVSSQLRNNTLNTFTWRTATVTVKDRKTKAPRQILSGISGVARAGELVALVGPSGSGKTTLLDLLAQRKSIAGARTEGEFRLDGVESDAGVWRDVASFVEQEDVLMGSLTVRETLDFASRLAPSRLPSRKARRSLVDTLLAAFGLSSCADTLVGTPIRKGISGGQKRRLSVASHLITAPKILFLDEPTSGLDSTASYETMSFIADVARRLNLIVIASIHQPSTATFNLFSKLLLLSGGKTCYCGPIPHIQTYWQSVGFPMPIHTNPVEFMLDLVNEDFGADSRLRVLGLSHSADEDASGESDAQDSANEPAANRTERIQEAWTGSANAEDLAQEVQSTAPPANPTADPDSSSSSKPRPRSMPSLLLTLLHRSFLKSHRDVLVYGIRLAMYLGLSILMGTVWLRLPAAQSSIQPLINAIFFGGAFMSFMAVAYVPAYLEDLHVFARDRANGLYGPGVFLLANFLLGLPYLFGITVLFSVVSYWLVNLRPEAAAFFTWVMWLYLDLLAAESLVVFFSSLFPNFVVSLALVAFANGLWMCVGGFLVSPTVLNVFWKYGFHYWDYQAYVFRGMMVNEFGGRKYGCGDGCACMYPTGGLQCEIPGESVLSGYGYQAGNTGKWVGIMLGIILGYRIAGFVVVYFRRL